MNQVNTQHPEQDVYQAIEDAEAAEALCTRLMSATADLISVLDRETSLVRKAKTTDITALTLRKQALATTISREMVLFRINADFIKSVAPERIRELKDQQKQFKKSLETNHDALAAVKAVSEQILQTVANKVSQKQGGPEVYGQDANMSTTQSPPSAAISIDRAL